MEIKLSESEFMELLSKWRDKYKLELGIEHHIRELDNKLDYIDGIDLSTYYKEEKDRLKYAYQKEMADLFILLLMFFKQSNEDFDDLINTRIKKLLAKSR